MRRVFEHSVKDKRIHVQEGTFESTGVAAGWADLIVIAQVRFPLILAANSPDFFFSPRLITGARIMTLPLPSSRGYLNRRVQ